MTTRFIKQDQLSELINLYHLARVALSGKECTKYTRMLWASKEFSKLHPEVSSTGAYKDLDVQLDDEMPSEEQLDLAERIAELLSRHGSIGTAKAIDIAMGGKR
jgi:hypothetical protein